MTSEPTRTIKQSRVHNFPGKAARVCGALNSFLVGLGDKCGLYATAQCSFDVEEEIARSHAWDIVHERGSSDAADGASRARRTAAPGQERTIRVQQEEIAFMTLICHDCLGARDSSVASP